MKRERGEGSIARPLPERVQSSGPWVAGRQTAEGTIVGRKDYESDYGSYIGLTLRQDDGRAVWFKAPASLLYPQSYTPAGRDPIVETTVRVGDRVRVALTITPKQDDPTFGIGKRPAKAGILESTPTIPTGPFGAWGTTS